MNGGVVEAVAQNGPQELTGCAFGIAQQLQTFGSRLFQHAGVHLVGLAAAGNVVFAVQLKLQNIAAYFFVEAFFDLLAQVAQFQQLLQHRRRAKAVVERVGLQAQVVLQRLDDVGHGVQAHHIGRAEGAGRCAAQLLAGQIVHHVIAQAKVVHLFHGRQHAGNADAVGDEVGRVFGTHHTLAQAAGHKGFQLVQHFGLGGGGVDQLHQRHVARWVEEVDATETRFDGLRQRFGELGNAQARRVRCHQRVLGDKRGDLGVQIELPVHALGNRLDDEVAALEQLQVLFVVGCLDQIGIFGHANG